MATTTKNARSRSKPAKAGSKRTKTAGKPRPPGYGRASVCHYFVEVRPRPHAACHNAKRALRLKTSPAPSSVVVEDVLLEFRDGGPPLKGLYEDGALWLELRLVEFADLYRVLQTEEPVQIVVRVKGKNVKEFRLETTKGEPPGEGLKDESP